jgi:hypothetical protein
LTDAYSGTYTLLVTDDGAGANTYDALLTVATNDLDLEAYIDWFTVHFDTPAATITSGINAPTDGWPRLSQTFSAPEASALMLFGSGIAGLVIWRRKKRLE